MELNALLVDIFELEAIVGLAMLAIVIAVLMRALLTKHRVHRLPSNDGARR